MGLESTLKRVVLSQPFANPPTTEKKDQTDDEQRHYNGERWLINIGLNSAGNQIVCLDGGPTNQQGADHRDESADQVQQPKQKNFHASAAAWNKKVKSNGSFEPIHRA